MRVRWHRAWFGLGGRHCGYGDQSEHEKETDRIVHVITVGALPSMLADMYSSACA
jgi:hypothetical protein